jgi:hypothetical protein
MLLADPETPGADAYEWLCGVRASTVLFTLLLVLALTMLLLEDDETGGGDGIDRTPAILNATDPLDFHLSICCFLCLCSRMVYLWLCIASSAVFEERGRESDVSRLELKIIYKTKKLKKPGVSTVKRTQIQSHQHQQYQVSLLLLHFS